MAALAVKLRAAVQSDGEKRTTSTGLERAAATRLAGTTTGGAALPSAALLERAAAARLVETRTGDQQNNAAPN